MTDAIEAARRILAGGRYPDTIPHTFRSDAHSLARFVIALTDAKDDLAELWEIAGRAVEIELASAASCDLDLLRKRNAALMAHEIAFNPTVAQRLIAEIRMLRMAGNEQHAAAIEGGKP